jgi:ABC-type transporter Mla subunit MlaD
MQYLHALPDTVIGWVGLLIATTLAAFTAYYLYNKNKDGADDRLIGILNTTVKALEDRVNEQHEDLIKLTKKINILKQELDEYKTKNEELIKILQGRDKATLQFQQQMLEAVTLGMETNGIAKENNKRLGELMGIMKVHLETVETRQRGEEIK